MVQFLGINVQINLISSRAGRIRFKIRFSSLGCAFEGEGDGIESRLPLFLFFTYLGMYKSI